MIPGVTNFAERGERVSSSEDPRCEERRRERRESLTIRGVTNAEREARESGDPGCDKRRRERGERVSRSEA